ncbi:hypothetical protein ACFORL_03965 [Legionella dresdenensis]|uniref:Proteolipid membrane potential modulator n=1 Tax=Legionella dresdenensis TaxID=450200 RepID=A0ABV8CD46_9GAMM
MFRRLFLKFLALAFPWVVLLMYDNPGGAFVALAMQATIIGWLPAGLWALRLVKEREQKNKKTKKTS